MSSRVDAMNMNTMNSIQKKDVVIDRNNVNETIVFPSGQEVKVKDIPDPKEVVELAHQNGYDKKYDTEIVQKDGKTFIKVTVKKRQSIGILAEDYMPRTALNDGTLKRNNPGYFDGIHCEDGNGRTISDLNYRMKKGDSLLIPIEKIEIKESTVGWFRRNILNICY